MRTLTRIKRTQTALLALAGLALIGLVILAGSTGTLEVGLERTSTPNLALTGTIAAMSAANDALATQNAMPTATLRSTATSGLPPGDTTPPTPTPTPPSGHFSNLRFTTQPETNLSQHFYVAGVPQIYAIWDYENVQDGMVIRREWRRNNIPYIVKEETWDEQTRGRRGTVNDVVILNPEVGEYRLYIYINGVLQDVGIESAPATYGAFWVFEHEVPDPVPSPDRTYAAIVTEGGHLEIEYPDGTYRELVVTQEISNVTWFPSGQHLLYEDRDRSNQVNEIEDWGITHKLWVLDVETGERRLVATTGENFHSPVISPTGRYVAALAGTTFEQSCQSSPTLVILELDSELRRSAVYTLNDFTGLPYIDMADTQVFPQDRHNAGYWDDNNSLVIDLSWTCLPSSRNPQGVYRLDLSDRTAMRTGDF